MHQSSGQKNQFHLHEAQHLFMRRMPEMPWSLNLLQVSFVLSHLVHGKTWRQMDWWSPGCRKSNRLKIPTGSRPWSSANFDRYVSNTGGWGVEKDHDGWSDRLPRKALVCICDIGFSVGAPLPGGAQPAIFQEAWTKKWLAKIRQKKYGHNIW